MRPMPVSRPHPPIWIGGNSARSVRRAVEHAQGWAPFNSFGYAKTTRTREISTTDDLARYIGEARAYADERGRTEPLDICFSAGPISDATLPAAARRDEARRLEEIGVTWYAVAIPGESRAQLLDGMRRFADEVMST